MEIFAIWSSIAIIFIVIAIITYKSDTTVGFFTFSKLPEIKKVKEYNRALGKMWFVFAIILEITGIPLLFAKQNSPIFILIVFGVIILIIGFFISYLRIERKYKEK